MATWAFPYRKCWGINIFGIAHVSIVIIKYLTIGLFTSKSNDNHIVTQMNLCSEESLSNKLRCKYADSQIERPMLITILDCFLQNHKLKYHPNRHLDDITQQLRMF